MGGLLIVDADADARSALARVLESAGHRVVTAGDAEAAWTLALREQPDIALIGLHRPDLDGIAFAQRLRAEPTVSSIALLHTSDRPVDSQTQVASFESGAGGCLALPMPPRELLARIDHLLREQQAAAALRRSEQRQQRLIEQMADGVLVVAEDDGAAILFANREACTMFGRPPTELVGLPFGHALLAQGPVEIELLRAGSNPRLVHMRASAFEWEGIPARLISLHDVSELHETARKLLDRQQRYRSLFEHHPDAVFLIDADDCFVEVNPAFSVLTGRSESDALGCPLAQAIAPDMLAFTRTQLAHARTGKPVCYETIVLHRDGRQIRVEVTNMPMAGGHGMAGIYGIARDISRRHAAEAELLRSRSLLDIAGRTAGVGGWSFDVQAAKLNWSPGVARIHGMPAGFSPDLGTATAFYVPPGRDTFRTAFEACVRDGIAFDVELEIVTAGGERRWVRSIGEPQFDRAGGIVGAQGAIQEISQRKAAERAATQNLARFRLLAEASLDAIAEWNLVSGELWWIDGYQRLFGREPDITDPPIDGWLRHVHPDDRSRVGAALTDFIAGSVQTSAIEYRYQHADGRWLDVMVRVRLVRDTDGSPVRIVGGMTDVSEIRGVQRRIESQLARMELLQQITHAIGERDDLDSIHRAVCEQLARQMPAAFVAVAEQGQGACSLRIRHVAATAHELAQCAGLSEGTCLGSASGRIAQALGGALVYEADTRIGDPALQQHFAGAGLHSVVLAPLQVEAHQFGVLLVGRTSADGFGHADCEFLKQLSGHVALAAQQAQLHHALQCAYDRLRRTQQGVLQQERLRALGEMASGIAHDINNAVSPAALYAEALLENERGLSPRGRERLTVILRAIEDVAQTVARMREFYRPHDQTIVRHPVDLAELAGQAIELTRARWRDMPQRAGVAVDIVRDFTLGLPCVHAVEAEIREALTNLIFNAVDAMPRGGRITVRTLHDSSVDGAGRVTLELIDSGLGMDDLTLRRCMEPFFTTKGERGTGLGLAMVYGTMQRHGGEVDIVSSPGHGTSVRLRFPARDDIVIAAPPAPAPQRPARSLRVLVVDDDPLLLRSLSEMLRDDGHQVETAAGGAAAIERLSARGTDGGFDLVLTDLGMPHVDGLQVARAAKAVSQAPVVMLTGWGQRMNEDGEHPSHVDRIVAKPPRLAELRSVLAELCPDDVDRSPSGVATFDA